MRAHQQFYMYALYLSYILYAIALTGIVSLSPMYLNTLNLILKYYVCIFLIIRFNPWIPFKTDTKFDKMIVFTAGIFLLLTTTITDIIKLFL